MSDILMSINPQHVDYIFSGKKTFEFRKRRCKEHVDKIYIYETAPIQKVVGEARVEAVLVGPPSDIWKITGKYSGIKKEFFDFYFQNRKDAVAYKLVDIVKYDDPKELIDFGVKVPPQSFQYVTWEETNNEN